MNRGVLGISVAALLLFGSQSHADDQDLLVLSSQLHQNNLRAMGFAKGGVDAVAPFEEKNHLKVNFNIMTSSQLQSALPRVGMLSSSKEDLIYISQSTANPRIKAFLAPLDDYLAKTPIEGFPGNWVPAAVKAATIDGKIYMLPVRCGTEILWVNKEYMAGQGIAGIPKTPEELYDAAKKGTFTKPSGEKVYGFSSPGDKYDIPMTMAIMARMYGGDLVDESGQVVINKPEAVKAVELLRRMYAEGLMPPNWTTVDSDQLFRDGHLTMEFGGASYLSQLEALGSAVAGKAEPAYVPLEKSLWTADRQYSASGMFYWGIGILRGSQHKDMAFSLVQHVAEPWAQSAMADNGNSPCTLDLLTKIGEKDAGVRIGTDTLKISRPPLPGSPRMSEIADKVGIAIQNIVANGAPVQETLDALASDLTSILAE
ncbi:MAG TPA: extracellular solute-binding protein [Dongiaceae bacterium]|nr:extracellular solute-binding protein [Dongiaceae bacterium]